MRRTAAPPDAKAKRTKKPPEVKGIRVSVAEARNSFTALLDRVATGRVRVVIERAGKVVGFLGTSRDLTVVVEEEEDREDIGAAEEALKEPGFVTQEELKGQLGLS